MNVLGTLMQEASAVPLRAVRKMQHEFIQAQAAMIQQSLAVQQRALSQLEESLRVQQSLIAQLASSAEVPAFRVSKVRRLAVSDL